MSNIYHKKERMTWGKKKYVGIFILFKISLGKSVQVCCDTPVNVSRGHISCFLSSFEQ